jgi:hypothetical protein
MQANVNPKPAQPAAKAVQGPPTLAHASAAAAQPATPAPVLKGVPAGKTVTLLVAGNPKKPGSASAARFALYKNGITVAAYQQAVVAAGQPLRLAAADLLWDQRHGFIKLA